MSRKFQRRLYSNESDVLTWGELS